jgi:hypothetical protein
MVRQGRVGLRGEVRWRLRARTTQVRLSAYKTVQRTRAVQSDQPSEQRPLHCSARLAAPGSGLLHLGRVAPHLHADEHFDIAGIASQPRGRDAAFAKSGRILHPFLFQILAGAFLVRQTLPQRRVHAVAIFAAARQPGSTLSSGTLISAGTVPAICSKVPITIMMRPRLAFWL